MPHHFIVILLRISRFPFLYIFGVGAYAVAASAGVLPSLGLHNVFLEDEVSYGWEYFANRPSFLSQIALSLAIAFAWFLPAFADGEFDNGALAEKTRRWAWHELPWALAVNMLLSGLIVYLQCEAIDADVKEDQIRYSILGIVAGMLAATATTGLALYSAHRFKFRPMYALLGLYAILPIWIFAYHKLIPAVCIFALFLLITLVYVVIKLLPRHWRLGAAASIVVAMVAGYALSAKYQFPGINRTPEESYYKDRVELAYYYECPKKVRARALQKGQRVNQLEAREICNLPLGGQSQRGAVGLTPTDVLAAWKETLGGEPARRGGERVGRGLPCLVLDFADPRPDHFGEQAKRANAGSPAQHTIPHGSVGRDGGCGLFRRDE